MSVGSDAVCVWSIELGDPQTSSETTIAQPELCRSANLLAEWLVHAASGKIRARGPLRTKRLGNSGQYSKVVG